MSKFRKKPVVIDAIQWNGKWNDIKELFPIENASSPTNINYELGQVTIHTLEGDMVANLTDWIIKGVNGECYPCKNEIFLKTYEPVN